MGIGQSNAACDWVLLVHLHKARAYEKRLGVQTDICADLCQAAQPGQLLQILNQLRSSAHSGMGWCYKKVINIAVGLKVSITGRLAVRVYKNKGLQRLHTRSPCTPVWLVWRPCVELLWCVV